MKTLTIPQAADILQLSRATVARKVKAGEFPGWVKIGGSWRITESRFAAWLEEGATVAEAPARQTNKRIKGW